MINRVFILTGLLLLLGCKEGRIVDNFILKDSKDVNNEVWSGNFYVEYLDNGDIKVSFDIIGYNKLKLNFLLINRVGTKDYYLVDNRFFGRSRVMLDGMIFLNDKEAFYKTDLTEKVFWEPYRLTMNRYELTENQFVTIVSYYGAISSTYMFYHDANMHIQEFYIDSGYLYKSYRSSIDSGLPNKKKLLKENLKYQKFQQDSIKYIDSLSKRYIE